MIPPNFFQGVSAFKAVEQELLPLYSATVLAGKNVAALAKGENTIAVQRRWNYIFQRDSLVGNNYAATALDVGAIIRQHHQQKIDPDGVIEIKGRRWTRDRLRDYGIDAAIPGTVGAPALGYAGDWAELIRMSASAAPLEQYVVQFWRTGAGVAGGDEQAAADLDFALRRGGYSRVGGP